MQSERKLRCPVRRSQDPLGPRGRGRGGETSTAKHNLRPAGPSRLLALLFTCAERGAGCQDKRRSSAQSGAERSPHDGTWEKFWQVGRSEPEGAWGRLCGAYRAVRRGELPGGWSPPPHALPSSRATRNSLPPATLGAAGRKRRAWSFSPPPRLRLARSHLLALRRACPGEEAAWRVGASRQAAAEGGKRRSR